MHQRRASKRMSATAAEATLRLDEPTSGETAREAKDRFVPQTSFGRRLWSIRKRIIASGQTLLEWEGLEKELHDRRGEHVET